MQNQNKERLAQLYSEHYGVAPAEIRPLEAAGSDRRYYLLLSGVPSPDSGASDTGNTKIVGTAGDDIEENRAFIYLARHFFSRGLPVPEILAVSADESCYLQSYAGNMSVFDCCEKARRNGEYTETDAALLERAMRMLARIQTVGAEGLDFSRCFPEKAMNSNMVRWDMNYFKYCFLKPEGIAFSEELLQRDFDRLEEKLLRDEKSWNTFMYRDFQSRNVLVGDNGRLTAIDFQGGRRGPRAYDVASFLWQAKAGYPDCLKQRLIGCYADECEKLKTAGHDFDREKFAASLPMFLLFREMQTLGAYGFRGSIEKKPHFLQSLPLGVRNIHRLFTEEFPAMAAEFPELAKAAGKAYRKYYPEGESPAGDDRLTVTVQSFSYRKGYPVDPSGNGGGFIFDCRAVHNPGRYEQYKPLTGMDEPVMKFLEDDGEIFPFLENAENLVSASVKKFLKRGFTSLSVGFGCTGGRHRSVYSAHAMAEFLRRNFPEIRVIEIHREQPQLMRRNGI